MARSICRVGYSRRLPTTALCLSAIRIFGLRSPIEFLAPSKGKAMSAMPVFVGIDVACAEEIGAWFDAYRATNLRHR